MSEPYEELVDGELLLRLAPDLRHETICARLHQRVSASLTGNGASRLLAPRAQVELTRRTVVRPDLALVTAVTGKLWLAAEVISSDDHRSDTVTKKEVYENVQVPRLWMIDPRYDNIEVYHGGEYGLALKGMLAGRVALAEPLLPTFHLVAEELF
jgi:Uma2 family endonuclease